MVLNHFLETGEYIPKSDIDADVMNKLKRKGQNIEYSKADWIGEMFYNASKGLNDG